MSIDCKSSKERPLHHINPSTNKFPDHQGVGPKADAFARIDWA
jgi:hypothetical protein